MLALVLTFGLTASPAGAAVLRLTAYDQDGAALTAQRLLDHIAPRARRGKAVPETSGIYVTDLFGNPIAGRPWWLAGSTMPAIAWHGAARVKISLPWPVADDGFSTVSFDKEGAGYADGESILLNEEVAATQYRIFRESVKDRMAVWEPNYKPGADSLKKQKKAEEAMAKARAAKGPAERARLFEKALTATSLAWAKVLFEHGSQAAAHPRIGPALRWGLTLDETLVGRLWEYERVLDHLEYARVNWVRLVFRLNPDDFLYANQRSYNEYDRIIADLAARDIRVMGSVLDSALWPSNLTAQALRRRTSNLVLHYKDHVRSWEVGSEPNGTCLGGVHSPLFDDTIMDAVASAAAEVKRIDPSLETVATIYWWEGTAADDRHATFTWLKRAIGRGVFSQIDLVGLSVYPEDNPFGMAFDPVFRELGQYFPTKRLMLGGFGYVEGRDLTGYWWFDSEDVDGARKDLIVLYTGAATSVRRSVGGGFWWHALTQMMGRDRRASGTLDIYRQTLKRLGR